MRPRRGARAASPRAFRSAPRPGAAVDAHGDLHLQHLFFERDDSAPIAIDCLEFSERLRHIDAEAERPPGAIVVVTGSVGSGKSTAANALAEHLGCEQGARPIVIASATSTPRGSAGPQRARSCAKV